MKLHVSGMLTFFMFFVFFFRFQKHDFLRCFDLLHAFSRTLESCHSVMSRWFIEDALLLNPTKTETVVVGRSHQRVCQVNKSQGVWVTGAHVQFTDAVKLPGVTLDSTLYFDIIDVTRCCHYHIRAVRHIHDSF